MLPLQGVAMLATTLSFDWDLEAKRAAVLLNQQHDAMGAESEALLHPASSNAADEEAAEHANH